MRQLKTELAFTSLHARRLATWPAVTVDRIDLAGPARAGLGRFPYTPDALRLEAAAAVVAQGRAMLDPMTYSFAPGRDEHG